MTACYFCGVDVDRPVNTAHWSGSADRDTALTEDPGLFVRVDVCESPACRGLVRAFPRRPRRAKTVRPLYGDFAAVAQLNGISTDGTGRRVRR